MFNEAFALNNDLAENIDWNTAIYVRISEEEKKKSVSDSIENQKEILSEYAEVHHLSVYKIYEDDGFRGGSFNRPAFNRMIKDIENGNVNCVLVKDLSRFGREHIDADHYLERYFPEKGVRFISVIQGLDSVADPHRMNSIEVPMLNIFNEQYLRQVSNSTKASLMIKRKEGKFVGSLVPYGYMRDIEDKYHLIVDEEVYRVVQNIFEWFLDYTSLNEIADRLNKQNIPSPKAYRMIKKGKQVTESNWTHMVVKGILKQEIYTGDMVQGKSYSYNCKVNKREPLPRDKWDIVENTHEPIVEKSDFKEVQNLLSRYSKPKRKSKAKTSPSIFSGFLTCKDCGKKMIRNTAYYKNELGERVKYNRYICATSKKYGADVCGTHMFREDVLIEIILDVINTMVSNVIEVSSVIQRAENSKLKKQIAILENQLFTAKQSLNKLTERITGLYTDYKDGIINLSEYKDMKRKFSDNKNELQEQTQIIQDNIIMLETECNSPNEAIMRYMEFKDIVDIDRNTLSKLVNEIYIDNEKNVTIDFKFKDEIKQYCNLLE